MGDAQSGQVVEENERLKAVISELGAKYGFAAEEYVENNANQAGNTPQKKSKKKNKKKNREEYGDREEYVEPATKAARTDSGNSSWWSGDNSSRANDPAASWSNDHATSNSTDDNR